MWRGRGAGRGLLICCLLALAIQVFISHPFQDGTPFLLLIETPPTFWALSTFLLPYIAYLVLNSRFCVSCLVWGGGVAGREGEDRG